ncbi:MAG TPA: AMP-binding protein [Ilumatobacter sp.]|nr:AMP-binding protein [Ilumatobacter sp.]
MNLANIIDGHAGDSVALISRNRETTYDELRSQVARVRGGLMARGLGKGDRVVILCGNNRYFVVSYLAIVGLGAVAIPLNPMSPGPELARELSVVQPHGVIVGPAAAEAWGSLEATVQARVNIVVTAEGESGDAVSFDDLLAADAVEAVDVEPDAIAVMMFTSGTAGEPRAAMLSHGNLLANLTQSMSARDHCRAGDIVYGVLPLFHIYGLNVVVGLTLSVGATALLVQRFDPATAAQSIVQRGVTVVPGAPPMWVAFSHFDELAEDTFTTVRIAFSGASRLLPKVAERLQSMFGLGVYEGYGLTEASPIVTSSVGFERRVGSVGRALVGVEIRLVGDDGEIAPVGDTGEILVRGDNVFQGYFNDQEATDRVLVDGWLRTGDLGIVDDDGYLYLVDRVKDLIIVSGFNVFPGEVEEILAQHPAVAEVGVLGVPHPHDGEAVKAYVVLNEGSDVDEESLIRYAADFLARYKCPTKVIFTDSLPRNASGKLVRRELEGTIIGSS